MSSRLVQIGEKATREIAELGDKAVPEFDSAAAEAARAAGFSDSEIIDLIGYLPRPSVPSEPVESEAEAALYGDYRQVPAEDRSPSQTIHGGVRGQSSHMPRFSLDHYEMQRDPGETDEEYEDRKSLFR